MATSVTSLPSTSAAVNIQIFEPKNFPNGATPGVISQGAQAAAPQGQSQEQAQLSTQTGNAQQDLQNAYQNALNSRNAAEQARNNYLQLAGQLNNQAYQQNNQQQAAYPQQQAGYPAANVNQPVNNFNQQQQQQAAQQQQQQAYQQYQQQQQAAYQQQLQQYQQQQQAYQQQQQQQAALQQQQAQQAQLQQQQAQQQQAAEQAQQQQQPATLENAPVDQLNMMIAQPQTLQDKVNAMEELAVRGQGSPETFELLKREAGAAPPAGLSPQQADEANYVRQAALWTLGMLNRSQNPSTPVASLPGVGAIEQILKNKNENPDVKAAAVQALQVMNRSGDPAVKKILKAASKDKNPDVKALAQQALSGGPAQLAFAGNGVPQFASKFNANHTQKLSALA